MASSSLRRTIMSLFSKIVLFHSGILSSYCYYSHASLAVIVILKLCSNYAHFIIEKTPQNHYVQCHVYILANCDTGIHLLALHPCCHHRWSECHRPHVGHCLTCFSELSQLTIFDLLPRDDLCMCMSCYFSIIMLKYFRLAI